MVRAVQYHKSALNRQLGEAIRIRRRGGQGCILNSKAEFDRCRIPRLTLDAKEEELNKLSEKQEEEKLHEVLEYLDEEEESWGAKKSTARDNELKVRSQELGPATKCGSKKREKPVNSKGARSKKLKYAVLNEDWGKEQQNNGAALEMAEKLLNREQEGGNPTTTTPTNTTPNIRGGEPREAANNSPP